MCNQLSARAAKALFMYKTFSEGNTTVTLYPEDDYQVAELRVHGNVIATLDPYDGLMVTDAGWRSKLTRDRLSALPSMSLKGDVLTATEFTITDWDGGWIQIPYWGKDVDKLMETIL